MYICLWQTKLASLLRVTEPSSYLLQLGSVVKLLNYLKLNLSLYVHRYFRMACIFCNQDVQTLRAKRKMYVWTCTKENPSCNLTCYNVQYVCIVLDWGTFMKNELLFFRTYISDPYLYCAISDLHSVLFSLRIAEESQQLADVQPCFSFCFSF